MVRADLEKKRLVRVRPEAWDNRGILAPMAVVHRPDLPLGPASRWLLTHLVDACRREVRGPKRVAEASGMMTRAGHRNALCIGSGHVEQQDLGVVLAL